MAMATVFIGTPLPIHAALIQGVRDVQTKPGVTEIKQKWLGIVMAAPIGHQKWGGRRAGTPNKVNVEVRSRIEVEADPVGFLIKVVKGRKVRGEYPTTEQRMRAAEKLLGKIVPEVRLSSCP